MWESCRRSGPLRRLSCGLLLVVAPAVALGVTPGDVSSDGTTRCCTSFVDGFDLGTNHGGWTFDRFGTPGDPFLQSEGGNPDWHLRAMVCCDVFPAALRTLGASPFTGDYLSPVVSRILVDVRVLALEGGPLLNAPLNLRLESDNDTPEDSSDDWSAFFHGDSEHTTPSPGAPWSTISFSIPSQAEDLPEGWEIVALEPDRAPPPSSSWPSLMGGVSGVVFEFGPPDPEFGRDTVLFYDVAMDNPRIEFVPEPVGVTGVGLLLAGHLALRRRLARAAPPSPGSWIRERLTQDGNAGPYAPRC